MEGLGASSGLTQNLRDAVLCSPASFLILLSTSKSHYIPVTLQVKLLTCLRSHGKPHSPFPAVLYLPPLPAGRQPIREWGRAHFFFCPQNKSRSLSYFFECGNVAVCFLQQQCVTCRTSPSPFFHLVGLVTGIVALRPSLVSLMLKGRFTQITTHRSEVATTDTSTAVCLSSVLLCTVDHFSLS